MNLQTIKKDYKEFLRMQGELIYLSETNQTLEEVYEFSGRLDWLIKTGQKYGIYFNDSEINWSGLSDEDYIHIIEDELENHLEGLLGLNDVPNKIWTPSIIILDKKNHKKCTYYFVHGEHEEDMVKFLLSKPEKNTRDIAFSNRREDVNWFRFDITSEDIELIKQTAWYKNARFNNEELDEQLKADNTIEVIMMT